MAKTVRYIFMQEYKPTVIESQVFSWLETTRDLFDHNAVVSVVSSQGGQLSKKRVDEIESEHGIRYYQIALPGVIGIRDLILLLFVLKLYFKHLGAGSLILQSRFMLFSFINPIISLLPKLKLVYEARGTATVEYKYSVDAGKISARKERIVKLRERLILKYSDLIISVSQKQKDFFAKEYGAKSANKAIVIPGAADALKFYYREELRTAVRERMGLEEKTVFLYSGRLDKPWQIPEEVFRTFKHIHVHVPNAFFIILTPDKDIAKQLFTKNGVPDSSFFITYTTLAEINDYLNATDYGILFRENLPINNQASPTKFAEYILSGLRVIISEGVGDFSGFVREHDCGQVVSLVDGAFEVDTPKLSPYASEERERISKLGHNLLSTQVFKTKLRKSFAALR